MVLQRPVNRNGHLGIRLPSGNVSEATDWMTWTGNVEWNMSRHKLRDGGLVSPISPSGVESNGDRWEGMWIGKMLPRNRKMTAWIDGWTEGRINEWWQF